MRANSNDCRGRNMQASVLTGRAHHVHHQWGHHRAAPAHVRRTLPPCEATPQPSSDPPPANSSSSFSSSSSAAAALSYGAPGTASSNGVPPAVAKPGLMQRVKEYFVGSKVEKDKLASLGMGAFVSYGVISNMTYGACLTFAWISFIKSTGHSPLAAGQWGPFLLYYGGIWAVQNFVRPLRFALAVALAPTFDKAITGISSTLRAPKAVGFGALLVLVALSTITAMGTALWAFGGFPDGLPALPFLAKSA